MYTNLVGLLLKSDIPQAPYVIFLHIMSPSTLSINDILNQ